MRISLTFHILLGLLTYIPFIRRWIRLLFGREFPFEEVLRLWDVIFAEDPTLDLVDLICVAMLLRIRWQRKFGIVTRKKTLAHTHPSHGFRLQFSFDFTPPLSRSFGPSRANHLRRRCCFPATQSYTRRWRTYY